MQTLATIAARLTTFTGTTDRGPGVGAQDLSNTGSCMPGTTGGGSLLLHPGMRATTVMTTSACRPLSPALTADACQLGRRCRTGPVGLMRMTAVSRTGTEPT